MFPAPVAPPSLRPVELDPYRPTWLPVWFAIMGAVVLTVVAVYPPNGQLLYPRCVFQAVTGWQCPGCGVTRATHALLHGDLAAAWRLNPLWVGLLPLLGWTYLAWLVNDLGNRRWFQPLANRYGVVVLLAALAGFGVARNFPWAVWLGR